MRKQRGVVQKKQRYIESEIYNRKAFKRLKDNSLINTTTNNNNSNILKGVIQLVRSRACFPEVTSLSATNLKATRGLHGR